jgi:hypothetical protein
MSEDRNYLTRAIVGPARTVRLGVPIAIPGVPIASAQAPVSPPTPKRPEYEAGVQAAKANVRGWQLGALGVLGASAVLLLLNAFSPLGALWQSRLAESPPPKPQPITVAIAPKPEPALPVEQPLPLGPAVAASGALPAEAAASAAITLAAAPFAIQSASSGAPLAPPQPSAVPEAVSAPAQAAARPKPEPAKTKPENAKGKPEPVKANVEPGKAKLEVTKAESPKQDQKDQSPAALVLDTPTKASSASPPSTAQTRANAPQSPSAPATVAAANTSSGRVVGPAKETSPAAASAGEPRVVDQRAVTVVDIDKGGAFALITNPQTRLPEKVTVGQKIFTGETVKKIDPAAGKIQLDARFVGMQ